MRDQRGSRADSPDELTLALARAFDLAWAQYCGQGQGILSPDFARRALAKRLVKIAKEGVTDEEDLTAAGCGIWTRSVLANSAICPERPAFR